MADYDEAHDAPGAFCWARQVVDALLALVRDPDAAAGNVDPGLLAAKRRLIGGAARLGADSRIAERIDEYLRFAVTSGPENPTAMRPNARSAWSRST